MNKSGKFENDILGHYINPERIEKAPEGFTGKIMTRIQIEKAPAGLKSKFRLNKLVPVISGIMTIVLIVSAIFLSSSEKGSIFSSVIGYFQNLNLTIPELKFGNFTDLNLPGWSIYLAIGLFVLTLFDRVLNNLFHREGE